MESTIQETKHRNDSQPLVSVTSEHTFSLIDDALLVATYCLENGLLNQPRVLERLLILQSIAKNNQLSETDLAEIIDQFDQVSLIAGNVTANSLRETNAVNRGYWRSRTGRHLLMLWSITGLIGVLIFLYNMLEYRVSYFDLAPNEMITDRNLFWVRLQHYSSFLVPFTYGALGACAFLLRNMASSLKAREFDVSNIPQHWNRLFLGALSGGLIVMFVNQFPNAGNTTVVQISEGALGFLAGYSIDFLFNTLDRLLSAILPSKNSNFDSTLEPKQQVTKQRKLLTRYSDRLSSSADSTERKVLKGVIRDLK